MTVVTGQLTHPARPALLAAGGPASGPSAKGLAVPSHCGNSCSEALSRPRQGDARKRLRVKAESWKSPRARQRLHFLKQGGGMKSVAGFSQGLQIIKWQELILSHFWRPEIWNQVASRATLTMKALEGNTSLPFVASGGSICSLTYDNVTPISGSVFTQLSSVCLFVFSPLLIRTASLDSGPTLSPEWFISQLYEGIQTDCPNSIHKSPLSRSGF